MAINPFNWECPYCNSKQVVTHPQYHETFDYINVRKTILGHVGTITSSIACSNPDCNSLTINLAVCSAVYNQFNAMWEHCKGEDLLALRRILPTVYSKPQPSYIPASLREDYEEACAIRDLSPKASATLARRCIQGMIRDFCGISRSTLNAEIKELRKQLDDGSAPRYLSEESIIAIDNVREIGNIGAHMERDISIIVDVDPDEAQKLINLIEMLFSEWYIAKETRRAKLEELTVLNAEKQAARLSGPSNTVSLPKP